MRSFVLALILSMLLLALLSSASGQVAPITPLQPANTIPCPAGKACETFKQMAQGKDQGVLRASWACFYTTKTPSELDENWQELYHGPDEFFLLMDGMAAEMNNGVHPGIFESVVKNGLPGKYSGYGPRHGDLNKAGHEKFNRDHKLWVDTYDDLGEEFRFIRFFYTTKRSACLSKWPLPVSKEDRQQMEAECGTLSIQPDTLHSYDETRVEKSSGRFERKAVYLVGTTTPEKFAGQCLRLK